MGFNEWSGRLQWQKRSLVFDHKSASCPDCEIARGSKICLRSKRWTYLFFAPPKLIVQIYLWHSVELFLPVRKIR